MMASKASKGLGLFSIGLGLTQLLAPRGLGRLIGVGSRPGVMRALGARELLTGAGILARPRNSMGLWARVAGDVLDAALLGRAFKNRPMGRNRIASAAGMVLGVGVLDYLVARLLQKRRT